MLQQASNDPAAATSAAARPGNPAAARPAGASTNHLDAVRSVGNQPSGTDFVGPSAGCSGEEGAQAAPTGPAGSAGGAARTANALAGQGSGDDDDDGAAVMDEGFTPGRQIADTGSEASAGERPMEPMADEDSVCSGSPRLGEMAEPMEAVEERETQCAGSGGGLAGTWEGAGETADQPALARDEVPV
jgi:hypothetical protein